MRFTLSITGASGAIYGVRLLQALTQLGHHTDLIISSSGEKCLQLECGISQGAKGLLRYLFQTEHHEAIGLHEVGNIASGLASGSHLKGLKAGFIMPASMGTCGRIAHGVSGNLIERHADVLIKEKFPLIICPRETPLSQIHLANLHLLSQVGCIILPASPGFYHQPKSIDDLVDHVVGKALDMAGVEHQLYKRWK